ncbi:hypothetical protein QA600_21930 [Natronococcus sp. A-GB1]|nr:hypothetical protein [Natronococcus sp. A-GB1]MDG5761979.1 hypothetical protein [Natronococcus sp. A-GB1]
MNATRVDPLDFDGITFVLLLLILPRVSYGTLEGIDAVWGLDSSS